MEEVKDVEEVEDVEVCQTAPHSSLHPATEASITITLTWMTLFSFTDNTCVL